MIQSSTIWTPVCDVCRGVMFPYPSREAAAAGATAVGWAVTADQRGDHAICDDTGEAHDQARATLAAAGSDTDPVIAATEANGRGRRAEDLVAELRRQLEAASVDLARQVEATNRVERDHREGREDLAAVEAQAEQLRDTNRQLREQLDTARTDRDRARIDLQHAERLLHRHGITTDPVTQEEAQ